MLPSHPNKVPKNAEERLFSLWHWHQQRLRDALCEDALLLDCHSFPSDMGDVDICIGFNEDWSKPHRGTIELAVNLFMDNGYKVGINEPYSNSETPNCPFHYQSMMLEINKRVYMEEGNLRLKCPSLFKQDVRSIISYLMYITLVLDYFFCEGYHITLPNHSLKVIILVGWPRKTSADRHEAC